MPITTVVGGGPFSLLPGQWTDDTSMGLCMAESLIEKHSFQPVDHLEKYLAWYNDGHLSSNGECFDIGGEVLRFCCVLILHHMVGMTTRVALNKFVKTHEPYPASSDAKASGMVVTSFHFNTLICNALFRQWLADAISTCPPILWAE